MSRRRTSRRRMSRRLGTDFSSLLLLVFAVLFLLLFFAVLFLPLFFAVLFLLLLFAVFHLLLFAVFHLLLSPFILVPAASIELRVPRVSFGSLSILL